MNSPFDNLTKDELNLIVNLIVKYESELERDIKTAIEQDYPNYSEYQDDRDEYDAVCHLLDKLRGE